jgi:hypothetical protein
MKRIGIVVLTLVAMSALSGAAASTSQAAVCARTAEPNKGNWFDSICTIAAGNPKEFIRIKKVFLPPETGGIFCAEVTEPATGNRNNSKCEAIVMGGSFIRVKILQFWQRRGETLEKGAVPIKLQLKGTATLTAPELVTVECKSSSSEGSDIEGQGKTRQGQDKGRLTFKECKNNKKECTVNEPIVTSQTKSRLEVSETTQGGVLREVDVFEPTEGKVFTELKFKGASCLLTGGEKIDGSIAAELLPEGKEAKEGDLQFPEKGIATVISENGEEKVGLKVGATEIPSTFNAGYGAQLESGEEFGVGG